MLVDSFDTELAEMQQLIEMEDFPQLEHVLHRYMVQLDTLAHRI